MNDVILDASAVLALLQRERGHDVVEALLLSGRVCRICSVNLSEVISKLMDNGLSFSDACAAVRLPNLQIENFDAALAQLAASLRPATKAQGLSLGDRACLALGMIAGPADVYTADAVWKRVSVAGVTVQVVR